MYLKFPYCSCTFLRILLEVLLDVSLLLEAATFLSWSDQACGKKSLFFFFFPSLALKGLGKLPLLF